MFSSLDLASGYWQVGMTEEAKQKSTYITEGDSTSSKLCHLAFVVLQQICLVYLDDVIVYSKNVAAHLVRLDEVFQKRRKAELTLKPKKCHLSYFT